MEVPISVKEGRRLLAEAGVPVSEWKFHDLLKTKEIAGIKMPSKGGRGHWLVKRESVTAFISKVKA